MTRVMTLATLTLSANARLNESASGPTVTELIALYDGTILENVHPKDACALEHWVLP